MALWFAFIAAAPASALVPEEYVAKLYSEALGRIPDPSGWHGRTTDFASNGCALSRLQAHTQDIYTSAEFNNLGYDNESKLLALFRGALNREPDPTAFNTYLGQLNAGTAWPTVVSNLLSSTAFTSRVSAICGSATSTYWGTQPVMNLTVTGSGFAGGTGAQLQTLLNATPSGGTVYLAPKSVTRLTATLVIPAGVTLATTGLPSRMKYASMGRLVRDSAFNAEAVKLNSGSKLNSVWIDGRRNTPAAFVSDAINARIHGGSNTRVENSRMDNSRGWSTLQAVGWNYTCSSATIRNNLITAYSSEHTGGYWTDGLSIECENATVEYNEIIDGTDVPIVLFRNTQKPQTSKVRYNTILNAGKSAYGGLGVDPLHGTGLSYSFIGAQVHDNLMWTGTRVHWDIGIAVGTRAWFGTPSDVGYGVSVTNNNSPTLFRSKLDLGIAVSRMLDVTVLNNSLWVDHVNSSACPTLDVVAAVSAGHASGSIQPYTNQTINQCIGH